jgi:hypothetical protein
MAKIQHDIQSQIEALDLWIEVLFFLYFFYFGSGLVGSCDCVRVLFSLQDAINF